jgi:hypothetical protein
MANLKQNMQLALRSGVEGMKDVGYGLRGWVRKPSFKAVTATVVGGGILVASNTASASITCTGTSGLTACEWAKAVDFTDVTKAIGLLTVGLVTLGLVIFGARFVIAWASGRRSGL